MQFSVYFNGSVIDSLVADSIEAAQSRAGAAFSRPVVVIPAGAGDGERAAARSGSIKLARDANYGQPLHTPLDKPSAATRVKIYVDTMSTNSAICGTGGGPMLLMDDLRKVLVERDQLIAAIWRAKNEMTAVLCTIPKIGIEEPPSMMILNRAVRDLDYALLPMVAP